MVEAAGQQLAQREGFERGDGHSDADSGAAHAIDR